MATQYFIEPNPVWAFLDNLGLVAAGGKIYTWESNDHSEPKPVFTDAAGTIPWDNPITLDESGKQDYEGFTYPIFWANDEPYFIQIIDANGDTIFEMDGFPSSNSGAPVLTETDIQNYVINGQLFYDFALSLNEDDRGFTNLPSTPLLVAPGPFYFEKSNTSGTDELLIVPFNPGETNPSNNPKAYIQYNCTVPATGETYKGIYYQFNSVRMFSGETINLQFEGISSFSNQLTVSIVQNFGPNGSAAITTLVSTQALTTSWANQEVTIEVPTIASQNIDPDGGDYLAIYFGFPLNTISSIGLTNFCIRDGAVFVPFQEESVNITEIQAVGEQYPLSQSVNSSDGNYYPVLLQGNKGLSFQSLAGRIVDAGFAYANNWEGFECNGEPLFSDTAYNLANSISTNFGIGDDGFYATSPNGVTFTVTATGVSAVAPSDVNTHMKVYEVVPGAVSVSAITTLLCSPGSKIPNSSYFFISNTTINYFVWFNLNGTGVDPAIAGRTGVEIAYTGSETAAQIAALVAAASIAGITMNVPTTTVTAVNVSVGAVAAIAAGTSTLTVAQTAAGTGSIQAQATIILVAGAAIIPGSYFTINGAGQGYYVWFSLKNEMQDPGVLPALAGKIGIKIIYAGTETAPQMAALVAQQLINAQVLLPGANGLFARMVADGSSNDPDRNTRTASAIGGNAGDNVGSEQEDEFESHAHGETGGTPGGGENLVSRITTNHLPTDTDSVTDSTGGTETRPKNIYLDKVILK